MRHFDTLITADTLTLLATLGPNRRIPTQEARIRHGSSCTEPRENKHLI